MADTTTSDADRILSEDTRVKATLAEIAAAHPNLPEASKFNNSPQGESWVMSSAPQFADDFRKGCQEKVVTAIGDASKNLQEITNQLSRTKINIIYQEGLGENVWNRWTDALVSRPRHLLGMLASVIQLSLGTRFWFKTVRQLSSLKPATANQIERESAPAGNPRGSSSRR